MNRFQVNVTAFLLLLISATSVLSQDKNKTTIIFVCEHGGARSAIASLYFNKMVRDHHLPYRSAFRGLTPDSVITKETRGGLMKDGFETASLTPIALSMQDVNTNTLLISLDCTIPTSYPRFRAWTGIPAISSDYELARREIVSHLDQLIVELKKRD